MYILPNDSSKGRRSPLDLDVIKKVVQRLTVMGANLLCQLVCLKKKVKNHFTSDISLLHLLDEFDGLEDFQWV